MKTSTLEGDVKGPLHKAVTELEATQVGVKRGEEGLVNKGNERQY